MIIFFRKTLLICLLILVQSNNAYSQRENYQPLGIKWRSLLFSPLIESENEYDSNLFKTSNNHKDDFIFHLKPSLNIRSFWQRHALDLTVRGDIAWHERFHKENFEDIFVDLSGRIDVQRNSFATTKFYWSQRHEERGAIDNGGIDGPTEYTIIGGIFEYEHLFNRLRVNVSNDISYLDFENGISLLDGVFVEDDLRNRYIDNAMVQLSYEVHPGYEAFVRGHYNFIDYDALVGRGGFNRDSDGFEILAGVGLDFTSKLIGNVYVGYREQYYQDPLLPDISGPTGGASLKWLATQLTTVSLAVDNDIVETTQIGASGGVSTAFKVNIDHELLRYVRLNAHAGYTLNDYEAGSAGVLGFSAREDEYIILGFKAKYLYSNNFYLKGEYLYRQRESNIPFNDYESHRILFSIGLQL